MKGKKIALSLAAANLLLLPGLAFAESYNPIARAIESVATFFLNALLDGLRLVSGAIAGLASSILNLVLSPNFISWSYTGSDNPVVAEGLKITQSFVNMALVLVLVVIAFTTILRLGGYHTKELLRNLIIVALLVNFVPVIAGVIVDASNIIMYYFVGGDGISSGNIIVRSILEWSLTLNFLEQKNFVTYSSDVTETLAIIVFNMVVTFVLFIFAFIFTFRYVAIWVLVILAPLAFAAWILPNTKGLWNKWWNQFLQWCFVGATGAFFLYLADHVANNITTAQIMKADTNEMTGFFDYVFPHLVSVAFLMLGVVASLQTSAQGAKTVINMSKKAGKGISRGAWELGGSTKDGISKWEWVKKIKEGVNTFEKKHPTGSAVIRGVGKGLMFAPLAAEELPGVGGYARRGREAIQDATIGRVEETLGIKSQKSIQRLIDKELETLKGKNSIDIARAFKAGRPERKAAAAAILAERGELSLLIDKQQEEALKILAEARRKELGDIIKKYPHILLDTKKAAAAGKTAVEVLEGSAPGDISKNISKESLGSIEIVLHLIKDSATRNAMAKGSEEKRTTIKKTISSWGDSGFKALSQQEKEKINDILLDMSKDNRWNV